MGLQDFLARTQQLYEMHIYTHGNAEYAIEMAKLLDPSKRFFAERIISQVSVCAPARCETPSQTAAWGGLQGAYTWPVVPLAPSQTCNIMLYKHVEHCRGARAYTRSRCRLAARMSV